MKRKAGLWIVGYLVLVLALLVPVAVLTVRVDPFFHYHKPDTDKYYYQHDNQRSQNDGIIRNFDYTGLITGTSLTENFRTSEAEALWGGQFIKVPFSGATFRETNESIEAALRCNPELSIVIRGIESWRLLSDKDGLREDLGDFPTYLYDDDPLNDVEYVLNRDVVFERIYPMLLKASEPGFVGGITSFDRYFNWSGKYAYGKNALFPDGVEPVEAPERVYHLTDRGRQMTLDNVTQNLTAVADAHPDVTFYYFFTPYSAKFWMEKLADGTLERTVESERVAIEELLRHPNIRLYSFNDQFDLTTDLNNYKDYIHYGGWVNSMILRYMQEGKCLLTRDNYEAYLDRVLSFYTAYDYSRLSEQEDYTVDAYAALLLAERTGGPTEQRTLELQSGELRNAAIVPDQYKGSDGVVCRGRLPIDYRDRQTILSNDLRDTDYIGVKFTIDDIEPYSLITFYGKKCADHGQPTVFVYDADGNAVVACRMSYRDLSGEWTRYMIDVNKLYGPATVIFHGGYIDNSGDPGSEYVFSRISLF